MDYLKSLNQTIAEENNCELSILKDSEFKANLTINFVNSNQDNLKPGKVVYDFYSKIKNSEYSYINIFTFKDAEKNTILELNSDQLERSMRLLEFASVFLSELQSNELQNAYLRLDEAVRKEVPFHEFKKIEEIDFNEMKFSGLSVNENNLFIGFDGRSDRLYVSFELESENDNIVGFTIQGG